MTMVLRGGVRIAQLLNDGEPVLVHCSDGWDRTSQLSALGQLLVDPYYRTMDGFAALIEKEWCVAHAWRSRAWAAPLMLLGFRVVPSLCCGSRPCVCSRTVPTGARSGTCSRNARRPS